MIKKLTIMLCIVLIVSSFSGCSDAGDSSDISEETDSKFKVAFLAHSMKSQFNRGLYQGAFDAAKEFGIELLFSGADEIAETQANQMEDAIAREVDAILLQPVDAANEAGIPIFCIDTVPTEGEVVSYVYMDHYGMGQGAVEVFAEKMYERYGEHRGNFVCLYTSLGFSSIRTRKEAFDKTIAKYPNMKIVAEYVEHDPERAMNNFTNALELFDVDGIFSPASALGIIATQAVSLSGKMVAPDDPNYIYVISVDGTPEEIEYIKKGEMYGSFASHAIGLTYKTMAFSNIYFNGQTPPSEYAYPTILYAYDNLDSP